MMRCPCLHQAAETNRISPNVRSAKFCHFLVYNIRLQICSQLRSQLCSPVVAVAIECEYFYFVSSTSDRSSGRNGVPKGNS
jgi:hypothetical protein